MNETTTDSGLKYQDLSEGDGTLCAGGVIPPNATLVFEVELLELSE